MITLKSSLALDVPVQPEIKPHIATRPSLAFHGSLQVAVAETKTMVEQGFRVAFFAPSNGELERLADILSEYSVPFQLGLASNEAAPPYLARAYDTLSRVEEAAGNLEAALGALRSRPPIPTAGQ